VLSMYGLKQLLAEVSYRDWLFHVEQLGGGFFLQVRFKAPDRPLHGRKWYVSSFATESEIVQTALLAVLTAEEHEARERFLFCGLAIYGPHLCARDLVEVATTRALDVKPPLDHERRRIP